MINKAGHVAWAAEAVAVFQGHCGTGDEHAIADLICDLGHLADERGSDFRDEVRRGVGHWYAERHASDRDRLGPDAAVEISVRLYTDPGRGTLGRGRGFILRHRRVSDSGRQQTSTSRLAQAVLGSFASA
jgi:hypothetical protein